MITEEIRSYEVSIWTLQDEFITVLKWSDIEQKGRIQDPKMTLNIDGTQNFEFSIPMYIYIDGKRIENPNWYNTRNGNLMASMRKIKVIFNKKNENKKIYEFLIMNVEETHEKDNLICTVQCEGLAFHELGKIGYKYNLSKDIFELDKKSYDEKGYWLNMNQEKVFEEPFQTVDYWCDKIHLVKFPEDESEIRSNVWYYKVVMDWSSFESNLSFVAADLNLDIIYTLRDNSKVYEETYPKSWNTATLNPTQYEYYREKCRPVSAENSNIYNITQTIAETFEIFCRYDYQHDENNNIISRTVVFYNNFVQEGSEGFSLTYPYSSSKVVRTMDSKDLTTKLYVLSVDDNSTLRGYNTIMNSEANATREDYILNFDYLYANKIISEDQYAAIKPYEIKMREFNDQLIIKQQQLETYQTQQPEYEAKLAFYQKSIEKDTEVKNTNSALAAALSKENGDNNGYIIVDKNHPDYCLIHTDKNGKYYIELTATNKGISKKSVVLYHEYESSNQNLSHRIKNFYFEDDDYGFSNRIRGKDIKPDNTVSVTSKNAIYATYKYKPQLYYDTIIKTWNQKLIQDTQEKEKYEQLLGTKNEETGEGISGLYKIITDTENEIIDLKKEKEKVIREFERMMGPALREGYWQPEDYTDYGNQLEYFNSLSTTYSNTDRQTFLSDSGTSCFIGWDEKLFDEEQNIYYEEGALQEHIYYPCIDLSTIYNQIGSSINDYTFIFNSNGYMAAIDEDGDGEEEAIDINDIRYVTQFAIGSKVLLRFLRDTTNDNIIPVLMVVGAQTMAQDDIDFMKSNTIGNTYGGNPRLAKVKTNEDGTIFINDDGLIEFVDQNIINLVNGNNSYFIDEDDISKYEIVYPRIKFSSLDLKTSSSDITIRYNNILLEVAKDYYINTRNTERLYNNETIYYPEYYITIKPETIYSAGILDGQFQIKYALSNANTAIYLDALKVSKENAEPKVEYQVTSTILNREMISTLYNKLAHIVMINDVDLKFKNVFGYISGLELILDNPSEDTIEIKNYKTKFEDLFSTIVAQTEEMKKSGAGFIDAASGNVSLQGGALIATIEENNSILSAYLDSHFDSSQVVIDRLKSLFTEAGQILGDSSQTLDSMRALTLSNAEILSGFAENVAAQLSATVYRSNTKPLSYKPGDHWIDGDNNHWIATGGSGDSLSPTDTTGFVKTYYGTLASITGTGINIDTEAGIIDIKAKTEINLLARDGDVNIAAGKAVHITGNKDVTIGGPTINIAADAATPEYGSGAINIVSTGLNFAPEATDLSVEEQMEQVISNTTWTASHSYYKGDIVVYENTYYKCKTNHVSAESFDSEKWTVLTNISKVLINPYEIQMASADISMKGANKIQMVTSLGTTNNTSAISISSNNGIWIGSGKGVRLFSGEVEYNSNTDAINWSRWNANGASIELNSQHLILGYANTKTNSGNAIEMTNDYVIIAAGDMIEHVDIWMPGQTYTVNTLVNYNDNTYKCITQHTSEDTFDNSKWSAYVRNIPTVTGVAGGLVGAKFTKDSIGFATQSGTGANIMYNAIIMNNNGITIGTSKGGINLATSTSNELKSYFSTVSNGSYVRIANDGIELGTLANLYINTNNFKLQTNVEANGIGNTIFAIGSNLNNVVSNTDIENITKANVSFLVNANGAYINGTVFASKFVATASGIGQFIADSTKLGFYTDATTPQPIMTLSGTTMSVASNYTLSIGGNLSISSGNFKVDPSATGTGAIFYVGDSGNSPVKYIKYLGNGTLEVQGSIRATALSIYNTTNGTTTTLTSGNGTINLSALNFDSVSGASNGSTLTLTPGKINLSSSGSSILLDSSGFYAVGATVYLGTQSFANRENGTYILLSTNEINIKASDGAFKINGTPVWARGDIVYKLSQPGDGEHPTDREWLWVQPIGKTTVTYTNSGGSLHSDYTLTHLDNEEIYYEYWVTFRLTDRGSSEPWIIDYDLSITNGVDTVVLADNKKVTFSGSIGSASDTLYSRTNIFNDNTASWSFSLGTNQYRPHYIDSLTVRATTASDNVMSGSECKIFYFNPVQNS